MAFEQTQTQTQKASDGAMIPNTQLESMFLRICDDEEMVQYTKLIDENHISLATAYASNKVFKVFYALVERFEKDYGSISTILEIKRLERKKIK